LFISACEGKFEPLNPAGKVNLNFPLNVQVCPEGKLVGNTGIEIPLRWASDTDFTKYRIEISKAQGEKLGSIEVTSSKDTTLLLEQGVLYYWVVYGLRGRDVIPSEQWSFYTQGNPETFHIPYPATVQVNSTGGTTTINWSGSDEDDDIVFYDVYLSTENPPQTLLLEETELTNTTVDLTTGVTYYVQVVTTDEKKNSSRSQVIRFIP